MVLVALCVSITARSIFSWGVSAVERPSFPGFVLLAVLAVATVRGWRAELAEFRFSGLAAAIAGLVLYPAAAGCINYDTYVWGYAGYLLPAAIAILIAYVIYRGYLVTAFALNIAIAGFLLSVGASRNLWDYLIDPVAAIIGIGTSVAFVVRFLSARFPSKPVVPAQPISGIGETPISH